MFFPENVSKSHIMQITHRGPPISFSYFEDNGQRCARSSLHHEWSRVYESDPGIVFRLVRHRKSFYLFGCVVTHGGLI